MGCGASRGASDGGAISIWKPQLTKDIHLETADLTKDIHLETLIT